MLEGPVLTREFFTELNHQNNGKAFVLCEATRFLKDLFAQIECLRKENASLLSESQYVRHFATFLKIWKLTYMLTTIFEWV